MGLIISEIFRSIQGEGPKSGAPSVFLRLGGCNLRCSFCDTAYASYLEYAKQWINKEVEEVISDLYTARGNAWNLVITGGEPLLQSKTLRLLLGKLQSFFPSIEIETNGTLLPDEIGELHGISYNVSLKLANSGVSELERIKPEAIEYFANHPFSYFKFVVETEENIKEVIEIVERFYISRQRVYLMPRCNSPEELEKAAPLVAKVCIDYGFIYSDRLQFRIFKGERGK